LVSPGAKLQKNLMTYEYLKIKLITKLQSFLITKESYDKLMTNL